MLTKLSRAKQSRGKQSKAKQSKAKASKPRGRPRASEGSRGPLRQSVIGDIPIIITILRILIIITMRTIVRIMITNSSSPSSSSAKESKAKQSKTKQSKG